MKKESNIVLVGTYRLENAAWIAERRLYNLPLPACGKTAFHERVAGIVLFADGFKPLAFAARFKEVVGRDALAATGYSLADRKAAHGESYALYALTEASTPAKLLGRKAVEIYVASSLCPCVKIDAAFYAKPYPKTGGRSMAFVFDSLRPFVVDRSRTATLFNPVQGDFFGQELAKYLTMKNKNQPNLVSLFSGCGGLDLGFRRAGFNIVWANEFDKDIWETYERNHPKTYLCRKSICDIDASEVPECIGIIGGPPCQSWSEGGAQRGINDKRGQLFFDYIRILKAKKPLFFLAENVSGMLQDRHHEALENFKRQFMDAGYSLSFNIVNAWEYGVPQDRERVLFVGYRNDLGKTFKMPSPLPVNERKTLRDAIGDLANIRPGQRKNGLVDSSCQLAVPNHEYMTGGFSPIYMSRNRVRSWDEPSFTIQAGGRQSPIHPQAPKMCKVNENMFVFEKGKESLYRRLSVRESARIQTFPDDFVWYYRNIAHGYKMIGNAVPVLLAETVAKQIRKDIKDFMCGRR